MQRFCIQPLRLQTQRIQTHTLSLVVCLAALGTAFTVSAQPTYPLNVTPSRAVGTPRLTLQTLSPNVPEGREFYWPVTVAIDTSTVPSALYVSDSRNNRVLAWKDVNAAAGAPADLVLGQRDRFNTLAQGPSAGAQAFQSGFSSPSGLAVDGQGNLYVADSGNNRILRFPRPLLQDPEFLGPDMVIGQRNLTSGDSNQANVIAENTLSSRFQGSVLSMALTFDSGGHLWVTDPFNHRVLRFPSTVLAAGRNNPSADIVLGQTNLTTRLDPNSFVFQPGSLARKDFLREPTGIAFDRRGRLYVRDWAQSISRVLVYDSAIPISSGREATRIIGLPPENTTIAPISEFLINGQSNFSVTRPGLAVFNGFVYVPDSAANRILVYDPFEAWAAETPQRMSPPARAVIGQDTFNQGRPNRGRNDPFNNGLRFPTNLTVSNNEIIVADTLNNRVIAMPGSGLGFNAATRVLGQDRFDQSAPNLVEGKEFYFWDGFVEGRIPFAGNNFGGTCLALDGNRLYVADPANHRVLGFSDVRRLRPGLAADLVLGQPDLTQTQANWPNGDEDAPSQTGMNQPSCVAVDSAGDVWVADSGNGRVLRFPKPFDQPAGSRRNANLVIGQLSYTARNTDPTSRTMRHPAGLTFLSSGALMVSDLVHHRVLRFRKPTGGDFSIGQAADAVFGQSTFTDSVRRSGRELNRLSNPKGIAVDSSDRLYVCEVTTPATAPPGTTDRMVIFSEANSAAVTVNPTARQPVEGLVGPQSVYVNKDTGEAWVASSANNVLFLIPRFEEIFGTSIQAKDQLLVQTPMAALLDNNGVLLVADGFQRVSQFFPRASAQNAAGGLPDRVVNMAPSMYASLYGPQGIFGSVTKLFTEEANPLPMPTTVGDIQVFFNDLPAPIHFVSPSQINVIVPKDISTAQPAEITIVRASTGQVLAAARANVDSVSAALFTINGSGSGQVAATNQDGTVNSAANPAPRGSIITLYGTGVGVIPGAPADGEVVTTLVRTPDRPRVNINGRFLNDNETDIPFSGLAGSAINLWQINVRIPDTVPPNNAVPIAVVYRDSTVQTRLTIAVR